MNDLERKLRNLLEGHEDQQEPDHSARVTLNDTQALAFTPPSFALNDNQAIARALGADTLDGKTF